jgi:hypothetical protein
LKPYFKKYNTRSICALAVLIITTFASYSQTGVLTQHNDLYRTGWNKHEAILNTNNIKPASFGKIFTRSVDDQVYAQPLVIPGINIPGSGIKNIVIVATVNNTVYAFDADSANVNNAYWQVNLSPSGSRAVKNSDMTGACGGNYKDFSGNMGIVGTPVIDSTTNTIYLVARSVTSVPDSIFQQYLYALDITTGAERPNSPVLVTAQVAGAGYDNVGGIISFNSQKQNQRAGLLLLNGIIYIAWSSHCDWGPYHGWLMGYNKTSLQQEVVYNTTPEGHQGGVWMSASAPSADEAGNIYLAVGNGSVGVADDPGNLVNRSESALKLTRAGSTLAVSSFFTPLNYQTLESSDRDFGVAGMLLIPNTNRVLTGCKDGNLYLLDRDNMGGYDSTSNNAVQTITLGTNVWILRSSLAYYKGEQKEYIYSWSEKAPLYAFPYDRSADTLDVQNAIVSGVHGPNGGNGSFFSLSSNGSVDSTAVLWVNQSLSGNANQTVCLGILRAFSATDVTKELWNSAMVANDDPGNYAKFNCPAIANGKVYLATFSNKLVVYGLKEQESVDSCNSENIALNKPATTSTAAPSLPASAAFDGNLFTRWGSWASDPQSIYVDLGARYDLCRVVLKWEVALARDFQIQVSEDTVSWTTIKTVTGNTAFENYFPLQGSGRYVRMLGTTRGTVYGYSLWEFEVYGKLCSNQITRPVEICPGKSTVFKINLAGSTYQWQSDTGSGFADIADNDNYTGTNTPDLQLNNLSSSWYGYQYRCVVDGVFSNTVSLSFSGTWNGSIDNSWENPANWSCGALPDSNTDVIINHGNVLLNSNATIRSMHLNPGVNFTVNPDFTLTITN